MIARREREKVIKVVTNGAT
jgi:hypothetical protein